MSRLILKFKSCGDLKYSCIGKYDIQGFIYSLLKSTDLSVYHNVKGFKFFNFSNIFPVSDFKVDNCKNLIISSPNVLFINVLKDSLKDVKVFRLNKYYFRLEKVTFLNTKVGSKLISSTPIVLFENNRENKYYSFKSSPDFNFYFNRLKDNALKKYNAFKGENFVLDGELFSSFSFRKEVAVPVTKKGDKFLIIGSLWNLLELDINKNNKDFYQFLFDVGFGEKNSLGFGMLNNKR
jgi:CRISPR-associated endoribonuclease Cas6